MSFATDMDRARLNYRLVQADQEVSRIGLSGEDVAALDAAYSRADACAMQIGTTAPKPLPGDTPTQFKRHLIETFSPHSPRYKDKKFETLPSNLLDWGMEEVFNDAVHAARTAPVQRGVLRQHKHKDEAGRTITTWTGDNLAWMQFFYTPGACGYIRRPE
ncbi:MAG TPA: hypothetical protein VHB27_11995 [Rhodopila sp.]|uniref:hypothetical protein n=1 Tax=Rhodopila sp. TaxID=2480087 RepID=UPI002C91521D|nr:hypothetical protein [Rhodopila sp.]HVY15942.1 hypothetical protein [Rhodopila sp.]